MGASAGTRGSLRADLVSDGYALHHSAVGAELLGTLRAEAVGLVNDFYGGFRSGPDYWSYPLAGRDTPVLYRIHSLEQQPGLAAIPRLFADGPLHRLAATALGEPALPTVCAAVVKIPGVGAPVPWHRDRDQADLLAGRAVNVSLYLHQSTATTGCLEVIPGSQTLEASVDLEAWRRGMPVTKVPVRAGDATVHDVRLVHGSGTNPAADLCIRIVTEFRAESLPATLLLGMA